MKAEILREIKTCRACGSSNLKPILSLGDLYVSDFMDVNDSASNANKVPLELVLCSVADGGCGLLQSRHTVSHEAMYRNYWYRSGINKSMTDELNGIAAKAESILPLKSGDFVIDIGSNDGTLLRAYTVEGLRRIGFEPARNIVEKYGREGITDVITDFFGYKVWREKFGNARAKIITAIAMFYDLDDPNAFVADLAKCLDDNGVAIIQMLYLPSFLKRNAFDGICHEHLEYYSLLSVENLLKRHGLEIVDVEMREHINEGSFRVYARKVGGAGSLNVGPGAKERLERMRAEEQKLGLGSEEVYKDFVRRILAIKDKTVSFIKKEVASGKKVYAYAASTKGNTTLQFFGLDSGLIKAIADRNPDKWGKKTIGTMIPVISEEQFRKERPDYTLVLAWHFLPEFVKRESDYLNNGGKFIVPLPEFKIIDKTVLASVSRKP